MNSIMKYRHKISIQTNLKWHFLCVKIRGVLEGFVLYYSYQLTGFYIIGALVVSVEGVSWIFEISSSFSILKSQ